MKYIDLTLPLEEGMRGVTTESAKQIQKDGWNASTFHLYSHCGTHIDAPTHFNVNETTISDLPLEQYFAECWVVDCFTSINHKELTVESLGSVAHLFRPGQGLLFHTGWSRYLGEAQYRNGLPRISKELALWCVKNKVKMIGVEPPSVADVNNLEELAEIHKILLGANILVVEGLTNLEQITSPKVNVVALPLNIKGADGAPARVLAIESQKVKEESWFHINEF